MRDKRKYFSSVHTDRKSQLEDAPITVEDSTEIVKLRSLIKKEPFNFMHHIHMGDALSYQLRYKEAINAFSYAIACEPQNPLGYVKRAQRYLCLHKFIPSLADYRVCEDKSPEDFMYKYKIGLLLYYLGNYDEAIKKFKESETLCEDNEMLVAIIYWKHIARMRLGRDKTEDAMNDLNKITQGFSYGHHKGYVLSVRLFQNVYSLDNAVDSLLRFEDELDIITVMYSLYRMLISSGEYQKAEEILSLLLAKDYYWPSFVYIAAMNDKNCSMNL